MEGKGTTEGGDFWKCCRISKPRSRLFQGDPKERWLFSNSGGCEGPKKSRLRLRSSSEAAWWLAGFWVRVRKSRKRESQG